MNFRKKVPERKGLECPEMPGPRSRLELQVLPLPSPPHRVSNLESYTRLEAWDDLIVEAGGIEE
jgi:hypothetical protein